MTGARSPLAAFHPANTVTYLSLLSALCAMAAAMGGNGPAAGALVALSVVADTFDGKFARLFARSGDERAFGAHLDSLSDAIAFGAAPAVSMALLAPPGSAWIDAAWWTAVFAFAASAITRLAFFNITHEAQDGFVGLPAPVAALVWATVLLLDPAPAAAIIVLLVTAAAMVAPVRIARPTGAAFALFVLWPVSVIAAHLTRLA